MAQQTINVGTSPNDGTGTPLRTAFQYTNSNFSELYTAVGPSGNNIVVPGSATITGDLTVDTSTLKVVSASDTVGIRTATPNDVLEVVGSGANGLRISRSGLPGQYTTFSAGATGQTIDAAAVIGVITFGIGGSEQMRLNSTGLGVGVTPSAGKGCLQLSSGINFPATQVASSDPNTLDDYEEGTFTPTVAGSTSAGTGTYSNQTGYYTKVGRLVTVTVYLNWSAHTGTGDLRFASLPFTASNSATNYNGITIAFAQNIALTAGNVLSGSLPLATSYVSALQGPTGGGSVSAVPMDTSGEIAFTATYFV